MGKVNKQIVKGKISIIFLSRIADLNDRKKELQKAGNTKPIGLIYNFSELALGIEMRNATITAIMRCQSLPLFTTILKCLDTFDLDLKTFGKLYLEIPDNKALAHCQKMEKLYPGKKTK